MMKQLSEEFDAWQQDYNAKVRRWVPHYPLLLETVVTALPPDCKPHSILDLGCGNGNGASLLRAAFPNASFTLVDASEDMLAACRVQFGEEARISYRHSLFQELTLPAEQYDLALAVLALHHLKPAEKQVFFHKLFEWLRPGACLVYADLFANKESSEYARMVLSPWETGAKALGTTAEEWTALMAHHEAYDFPDAYEKVYRWLENAGFAHIRTVVQDGPWGSIAAVKA